VTERPLTPNERAGLANRLTWARRERRAALAKTALTMDPIAVESALPTAR
jgi:hypothetical protein